MPEGNDAGCWHMADVPRIFPSVRKNFSVPAKIKFRAYGKISPSARPRAALPSATNHAQAPPPGELRGHSGELRGHPPCLAVACLRLHIYFVNFPFVTSDFYVMGVSLL